MYLSFSIINIFREIPEFVKQFSSANLEASSKSDSSSKNSLARARLTITLDQKELFSNNTPLPRIRQLLFMVLTEILHC